jgi:RimJ/RimL family protein N-acetyltransferase
MAAGLEGHPGIVSARLRLVLMSPRFMRASVEGRRAEAESLIGAALPDSWPDAGARRTLGMRIAQVAEDPDSAEWLLRAMVEPATSRVAGYINFHGPPLEGRAEIGYTVFEPYRRRGYASEAAVAMMRWAHHNHGVGTFVVSISPTNAPSLALAAKLGFERIGTQIDDEDGEEWVFELAWPPPEAAR